MTEWQPMATAPKDRWIYVLLGNKSVDVKWVDDKKAFCYQDIMPGRGKFWPIQTAWLKGWKPFTEQPTT